MEIRNEISNELWDAIKKNYEAENYTGVILDAVFTLTNTIRNKTGLEGDGASLIGQAFGGDNPRIKLNKLQTDSEKDVQRGTQDILRGIYTAIRNPRSHDASNDTKKTADSILVFLNYLLDQIDESKLSFDSDDFLNRVFDPYYVKTEEYSNLLVEDIPKRQRANIAIKTILQRNEGDIYALGYFLSALLEKLESVDRDRVFNVFSDELRTTIEEEAIRYLVHMCPGKYWTLINKSVRIRVESILYENFSKASFDKNTGICGSQGALATWVTAEHLSNFSNLASWTEHTVDTLESDDANLIAYVSIFFWKKICYANKNNITWPLNFYFQDALKSGNEEIIEKLKSEIIYDETHPWWQVFKEELKNYPEIKYDESKLPF